MSTLAARYYDGQSAAGRDVAVNLTVRGSLSFESGGERYRYSIEELAVSSRMVGQPAIVDMPDGGRLEIADADAFYDSIAMPDTPPKDWEFRLEAYWSRIMVAVVVTGVIAWFFFSYGVPTIARVAAAATPVELDSAIGEQGLELLDGRFLFSSALPEERQVELRDRFAEVVATVGDDQPYRLEFRFGTTLGPNAIALPSGIVVVTDELVALAGHDEEIVAVMAHEVGHARNRHALRALIQNSVVAGLWFVLLGDPSGATAIAAGIPTLLLERSYSREFEREADDVAFEYLSAREIPDHRFTDLLERLDAVAGAGDAPSWLSTHPRAGERIRR